jgi:hypothetical protein
MKNMPYWSIPSIFSLTISIFISFLAGYICARIATKDVYIPTIIVASSSMFFCLLFGMGTYTIVESFILGSMSFGAVALGAYTQQKQSDTL